jgi:hypothetical protein
MEIRPNPRFAYQGIRGRPDFVWPGNKKLAVYVALCVEHFSYGSGLGLTSISGRGSQTRYRFPLSWLPVSRLLPPRSGLERSDFVLCREAAVRIVNGYGMAASGAKRSLV